MTRLHLMTWSLERSPVKSRLSRVPWSRSPRAPPVGASYTGASLRRSRSVPWPVALDVQLSGPIIMLLFGRRGHRQISTVTRFQAHPSGFLHWSRSPRAPPIGAFYTGVLLAALSIGSSAVCTLTYSLALLWWCCRPGRLFFCSSADAGTDKSVL